MARLALPTCLAAVVAVGCASTGHTPRPFPIPGGAPSTGASPSDRSTPSANSAESASAPSAVSASSSGGYAISATALSLRGAPYRDGGADPAGFDCSGFVKYVFEQHGTSMPRDVRRQFEVGDTIDTGVLSPGDLVFFTTVSPGASHVGIIVGGDQFVHAPSGGGVVRVDHLSVPYWSLRFIGAKRVN